MSVRWQPTMARDCAEISEEIRQPANRLIARPQARRIFTFIHRVSFEICSRGKGS